MKNRSQLLLIACALLASSGLSYAVAAQNTQAVPDSANVFLYNYSSGMYVCGDVLFGSIMEEPTTSGECLWTRTHIASPMQNDETYTFHLTHTEKQLYLSVWVSGKPDERLYLQPLSGGKPNSTYLWHFHEAGGPGFGPIGTFFVKGTTSSNEDVLFLTFNGAAQFPNQFQALYPQEITAQHIDLAALLFRMNPSTQQ